MPSVDELLKLLAEAKAKQGLSESQQKKLDSLSKSAPKPKPKPKSKTAIKLRRKLPKFISKSAKRQYKREGKTVTKPKPTTVRAKWLTNEHDIKKALKNKTVDVYAVEYKVYLTRYKTTKWETHNDIFRFPKDLPQSDRDKIVEQKVRENIKLEKEAGYNIQLSTFKKNNKSFEVKSRVKITSANQIDLYKSSGIISTSLLFQYLQDTWFLYSGNTKCWITAIVQSFILAHKYTKEQFFASQTRMITEYQIEQQLIKMFQKQKIIRNLDDGLCVRDIQSWAEMYKYPIQMTIWLPSNEKWFDSPDKSRGYSWCSSACARVSERQIQLHVEINNKHVYPIFNQKVNPYKHMRNVGGMLTQLSQTRKIGITDYALVTKTEYEENEHLIFAGAYKPDKQSLILPINFDKFLVDCMYFLNNKKSNNNLHQINPRSHSLVHPISHQLYLCFSPSEIDNFKNIRSICNKIQNLMSADASIYYNFSFGNQSIASVARHYYMCLFKEQLPQSCYSTFAQTMIDKYFPKPLTQTPNRYFDLLLKHEIENEQDIFRLSHHVDIRRSYTVAIYKHLTYKLKIPVFNVCDNIEFYDGNTDFVTPGLYFVENYKVTTKYYSIQFPPQFLPHFEVKVLVQKYGLIPQQHIKYQYLAKCYIKTSNFRKYVENVYKNFTAKQSRDIINVWTGTTHFKRCNDSHTFLTNDKDMIASYINYKDNKNVSFTKLDTKPEDPTWIVYNERDYRRVKDTAPIYHYIIGAGHLNVLEMLDTCMNENCDLLSLKTDAAYIIGNPTITTNQFIKRENIQSHQKGNLKHILQIPYQIENEWKPIQFHNTISELSDKQRKYIIDNITEINEYDFDGTDKWDYISSLYDGKGGVGKTVELTRLWNKYKSENKKVCVLAYTHSAIENLVSKCDNMRCDVSTLDAYFGFGDSIKSKFALQSLTDEFEEYNPKSALTKCDVFLIDEYSMVGFDKYFHILHRLRKQNPDSIIKLFGDHSQCPSTAPLIYDIRKSQVLKSILGKNGCIINMKYTNYTNQRCDVDIVTTIDHLMEHGTIPNDIIDKIKNNKQPKYDRFITYYREDTIKNNNSIRDPTQLKKGDIVICSENRQFKDKDGKKHWIYNNERLKLISDMFIGDDGQPYLQVMKNGQLLTILNTFTIYKDLKKYLFTLEKSETIYKYQGTTITEPYVIENVFEPPFVREMMITAIGRAKSINQIYIENCEQLRDHIFKSCYNMKQSLVARHRKLNEYKYYLMKQAQYYYIGHTNQPLNDRWRHHVNNPKSVFTDESSITLLGKYIAHNRADAERVEEILIDEYARKSEFKGYTMENQVYNNIAIDTKPSNPIKLTLEDYIRKYLGDRKAYYRGSWNGRHYLYYERRGPMWRNNKVRFKVAYTPQDSKQRKKRNSDELVPFETEAADELYQLKIEAFRQHNPQLYRLLTN